MAIAFGSFEDSLSAGSIKAYVAELIAMLVFVFAGVGAAVTAGTGLTGVAIAHGFALFVAVAIGANVSGGHVNPAVTFALAITGQITVITGIFYWVAQIVGSILASFLVLYTTGQAVPTISLGSGVGTLEGLVLEAIITFGLVYTVYATAVDPRKGALGTLAPLAIGLVVTANILAAGSFSGGCMNPARSFGPAVVSGDYAGNWVYWVGPLVGAGLAGIIYSFLNLCSDHEPLVSSV